MLLAGTQLLPLYTCNCSAAGVVSYHSCPSTGLLGAAAAAKFSNICRKFSAMADPYAVVLFPGI